MNDFCGHNRLRTGEQRTWYYPVYHLWGLERGSALKPTPGVHRIKLGLDLKLDHFDCAQRARSWFTYGWTLLIHNNWVGVIASGVEPCKGAFIKSVNDSPHHQHHAQTGPTGYHKSSDFEINADSQQVCYLRLSACWCCSLIYALGFCSECRLAKEVYSSSCRIFLFFNSLYFNGIPILIDTISIGLSIVYFKGSPIEFSK